MRKENELKMNTYPNTLVEIYCDGACKGNPGEAGSGLAIYNGKDRPLLIYGKYQAKGTNNTAELQALYTALLIASKCQKSAIKTDSKYSIDCITTWAYGWKKNGWRRKGGEIKNLEIIKLAHNLYIELRDRVTIEHIKAHIGIEGNELADKMASLAIKEQMINYSQYKYNSISQALSI
jgi:ribonuclease HI